jgi:hypothetical protein
VLYHPEREGFEPSRGSSPLLAFQASAFNRSTTSPSLAIFAMLFGLLLVGAASQPAAPARNPTIGHFRIPRLTASGSPAASPSPGSNVIANPSFESGNVDGGWYQCGDVNAFVMTAHPYRGAYDEYSGTANGAGEPLGNSGVCQHVRIPRDGLLTARLFQLSNEGTTAFAYQEADLLDDRGNVVLNLYKSANYRASWVLGRWNLGAYAGRSFWLYFGVHGDGYAKLSTQQFVDDVNLTGAPLPAESSRP